MGVLFGVFVIYEHFDWLFEACMNCYVHKSLALAIAGDERRVSHLKVIPSIFEEHLFFTAVLEVIVSSFPFHLVSLILRLYHGD